MTLGLHLVSGITGRLNQSFGQTVRVYYPRKYRRRTPKWQSYYSTVGTVVQKFNDATYLVKSKTWKVPKILHCDKLKRVEILTLALYRWEALI